MDIVHTIDFTQTLEMHVIVNITTKQSQYKNCCCVCLCDRAISPARGPHRAWASHIKLFCGPGQAWTYLLRAGPGPHNSICGPGPSRVFITAAGPGRAWDSHHICGPGLGLDFRPVQDTRTHIQLYQQLVPKLRMIGKGRDRRIILSWSGPNTD